jgi:large exoprotein involved in heme utilization and adhesion
LPSAIFSSVGEGAVGDAGLVSLEGQSLQISNGAFIDTSIAGTGSAGGIFISMDDSVVLSSDAEIGSVVFETGNAEQIGTFSASAQFDDVDADSDSVGAILIVTGSLLINDSRISTSTFGQGDAGAILLGANEIFLRNGIIDSVVGEGLDQSGGAIFAVAGDIGVLGDSIISVANFSANPASEAGNLFFLAGRRVVLENSSQISAETISGLEGNIGIASPIVVLIDGSGISTTAFGIADGGNIDLASFFVYGTPFADSNITAQAEGFSPTVTGGSIFISGFEGLPVLLRNIDRRPADFVTSNDITASSRFGIDGDVTVNALQVDPVRESDDLPQQVIDVSQLVAQGCAAGSIPDASNIGEFFIVGPGGLAQNPEQLSSSETLTDLVTLDASAGEETAVTDEMPAETPVVSFQPNQAMQTVTTPVIEAQGFQMAADGSVQLVAQAATAMPSYPIFTVPTCDDL